MVNRYAKNGTGGALAIIAMLLVAMAPLNLDQANIRLPDIDESNVYADKNIVKQGEWVTIGLSPLIRSEDVGIQFFVVDFHDNSGIYVLTTSDERVSHRYTTVGTYPVSVLALRGNLSRMFTIPITVVPDILDVSIQANTSNVFENQVISFEALKGDNIYSEVRSYIWEFGDGERLFGKNVVHSYNDSGIYTVKLRAYNNESIVYTDFIDITVNNKNPGIEIITSTNTIYEDHLVTFNAEIDDSLSDLSSLTYIWNFDDGEYGSGDEVEHTFLFDRTYDVTLTVIDDNGAVETAVTSVVVENQVPSVILVNDRLAFYEGETAITTAVIQDTANDLPTLEFNWNMDADGQQASIPMLDNGVYEFTLDVTDDDGAKASAATDFINIINIAPIVSLISAETSYNITFKLYGTVGTEVNMTLFQNDIQYQNDTLTSVSTDPNNAVVTTIYNLTQPLQDYWDLLFYVNNDTTDYDNYLITEFSFENANNFTLVNHCTPDKTCSASSWREPISPMDRGFPITFVFEYFDPGNDDLSVGVDFGTNRVSTFIPKVDGPNFGNLSITGQLPYGEQAFDIKYWGEDDDGARGDYNLPLLDYSTVSRPSGYLNNSIFWARWGHTITHFAPGAFVSLGVPDDIGNNTQWNDEMFEGFPQTFNAKPAYLNPEGLSYQWHFGDGVWSTTPQPVHTYEYSGLYLVWVKISDSIYESASYQWIDVINPIQNIEPMIVGDFQEGTSHNFAIVGLAEELLGTSNYQFIWNFGDGQFKYGLNVNHTYNAAGNYDFELTMLDEHMNVDVFSFVIPINASAPYVIKPLDTDIEIVEGNTLVLKPIVTDTAFDRLNLDYSWTLNGQSYTGASQWLQIQVGDYLGQFTATDNDGKSFQYNFNYTVLPSPFELTMNDYQLYGRTINTHIEMVGTFSPSIFTRNGYNDSLDLRFKLYNKNNEMIDFGLGLFDDELYQYTLDVDLNNIFTNTSLDELLSQTEEIEDIFGNAPNIITGDYRIVVEVIDKVSQEIINQISKKLKITADQDGDLITDELEILLSNKIDDFELNPLSDDTNDNGILDPVEFLLADDEDGDGLPSILENEIGTNPKHPDTDGDGLADGYGDNGFGELSHGTDPLNVDSDGDGVNDYAEVYGWDIEVYFTSDILTRVHVTSDPLGNDSDNDSMSDYFEFSLSTNPRSSDTDLDGMTDGEEQDRGTIPYRADSDNDGFTDYEETFTSFESIWIDADGDEISQTFYTDALNSDTDNDGISDWDEIQIYKSVATNEDTDQDYISDYDEILNGTDMLDADTDDDLLVDGAEILGFEIPLITITGGQYDEDGNVLVEPIKTNFTLFVTTNPLISDTDGDGLTDYEELMSNNTSVSNPTLADSDGDGITDAFDPYPLISDFAPPSFTTNINGETGISLHYKVGDNSVVERIRETLSATVSAIWGLMKNVGSLIADIIKGIFYWKCLAKIFGACVWIVPWIYSISTIKTNVRNAITRFVTASEARLNEVFAGYSSLGELISTTFGFSNFGVSIQKSSIGIPTGLSVRGSLKLFSTSATEIVRNLVDPTVNVKFTVEDDNNIEKIEVYQNDKYIKTIRVNAKKYNFNQDFSIIANGGGDTSTKLKFLIYDGAGNIKIVERTDSVTNFITQIVNQVVSAVKSVIDTIANWATNIVESTVSAIVEAAETVADFAVSVYESVKNFFLNVIPNLFKSFVIDTIGKYLQDKYVQSQEFLNLASIAYQNNRDNYAGIIDDGIAQSEIVTAINDSIYAVEGFFDKYLPPVSSDELMDKIGAADRMLSFDFIDDTIFKYVIQFLQDGAIKLIQKILSDMLNKLLESLMAQYLKPIQDIFDQILGVLQTFHIDFNFETVEFDQNGLLAASGIGQVISQLAQFVELIRQPTQIVTPLLDTITGDNILSILDVFLLDNPNILISVNDIVKSILTPITMLGIMVGDIIQWTGDLFSGGSLQLHQVQDNVKVNALGIPYDIDQFQPQQIKFDQSAQIITAKMIQLLWEGADIGFEFLQEKLIGGDRSDDGKVLKSSVNLNYAISLIRWMSGRAVDGVVAYLEGKSWNWDTIEIANGMSFAAKGALLGLVNLVCDDDAVPIGSTNNLPVATCSGSNSIPTLYDGLTWLFDISLGIWKFVVSIQDYDTEIKTNWNALDYVAGIANIVSIGIDMIFEILDYISGFGERFGGAQYLIAWGIAKGVTWIIELVSVIAELT